MTNASQVPLVADFLNEPLGWDAALDERLAASAQNGRASPIIPMFTEHMEDTEAVDPPHEAVLSVAVRESVEGTANALVELSMPVQAAAIDSDLLVAFPSKKKKMKKATEKNNV